MPENHGWDISGAPYILAGIISTTSVCRGSGDGSQETGREEGLSLSLTPV